MDSASVSSRAATRRLIQSRMALGGRSFGCIYFWPTLERTGFARCWMAELVRVSSPDIELKTPALEIRLKNV
jgi:hypothetical protein